MAARLLDDTPPPYVSVNVSIRQLHDERSRAASPRSSRAPGSGPNRSCSRSPRVCSPTIREAIVRRLDALKRLGLRIAVDDFGTGYSALSHLQQFPIDILKIDKSFIDELHTNPQKANLVQGIINLGETLELDVIAEGIEQPQQADQLRAMRSPLGQGFLFSRPVSPEKLFELLREPRHLPPLGTH